MPLTEKGSKILGNMQEQYGAEKGKSVFYASKNKGTISGVDEMNTKDVGASSTVGGKTTGYNINTAGDQDLGGSLGSELGNIGDDGALVLDDELTDDAELTPERQKELVGDIPKEKAEAPKDRSTLPDVKTPTPTMTPSLVPVTPLSIPVGDQSLSNMNARNRNFWRR